MKESSLGIVDLDDVREEVGVEKRKGLHVE